VVALAVEVLESMMHHVVVALQMEGKNYNSSAEERFPYRVNKHFNLSHFYNCCNTLGVVQLYSLPHFLASWLYVELVAAAKEIVEVEDGT
jgi:hypothetical protein